MIVYSVRPEKGIYIIGGTSKQSAFLPTFFQLEGQGLFYGVAPLPNSSALRISRLDNKAWKILTLLCMASPRWPSIPLSRIQDKFPRLGRSRQPNLPEKKSLQCLKHQVLINCMILIAAPPLPSGRKHCLHQRNRNGRWKLHLLVSTTHSPQQTPRITQNDPK